MPRDCLSSSVFPNCKFRLRSQQQLLETPEELLVTEDGSNLDTHSYMLFFKDEGCTDIAGIKGLVSGVTEMTAVDSSITCNEAVTCALAPVGDACEAIAATAKTATTIHAETTSDGRRVLSCLDDGSCQFVEDGCFKSGLLESCFVKWIGPTTLFETPSVQIKATGGENAVASVEEKKPENTTKSDAPIQTIIVSLTSAAIVAFLA